MWPSTTITKKVGITYPIIQAPMAAATTPKLVAEISNAGGLGSFGAALLSPDEIRENVREIKQLTDKPFSVNLFVPQKHEDFTEKQLEKIHNLLKPFRDELHLQAPKNIHPLTLDFENQLKVILEEKVPIFSFTFGMLPAEIIRTIKDNGTIVIGTATCVREAKLLENSGVDMIVAQGSEAGGHRGSFDDTDVENALIGSMALIPQIVDAVKIPVIAALVLGAQAVQMGTVFLPTDENKIHAEYRKKLLQSNDESTQLTRVFTSRYARGIKNTFSLMMKKFEDIFPDYYTTQGITRDIREAAAQQNNPEYMSLWCGQGVAMCKEGKAKDIFKEIVDNVKWLIEKCRLG